MTFEKILNDLTLNMITTKEAYDEITKKDKLKRINFYVHIDNISKDPLKDPQLQELIAIVGILQILYNANIGSPISDPAYDTLQEILVNMGIPRLTGSIEINDNNKVEHQFKNLRGTLDKVYYLFPDEKRTNKSRKYLDDWIKSAELLYEKNTGKKIDLNKVTIMLQCKFDGTSCILEDDGKALWLTRGDTRNNKASDVTHIMNIFNDIYASGSGNGIKFEVMMTEENKDRINELIRDSSRKYKNSRQIVTAVLNSNEADFKADYLYPVPLRIMHKGDVVEQIHPDLIEKFPTRVCTFGDRGIISQFANENRYARVNGMRFRTDGVVMTILDDNIKLALGRNGNINNFEVAYKFTEEAAYSRVKDIEFYVSDFGFITPVLIVNDVILKGNTVSRISLSNKERFDELGLCYGDEVKILYDIIPYATVDERCRRAPNGRKIEFVRQCPRCHEDLDLSGVTVQCTNPICPSRVIGRMLNYCSNLRIKNIGSNILESLYSEGLLNAGIPSLYKLRKHKHDIQDIEGFGKAKTKKIISEIESKRRLKDSDFFGSIGIQGSSIKTFELIFSKIKLSEFLDMFRLKNFDLMRAHLLTVKGIGESTALSITDWMKDERRRNELQKLLKEVKLEQTFSTSSTPSNGVVVFSGCRPSEAIIKILAKHGYKTSDSWINSAKVLVVPNNTFESSKVTKAKSMNVKIMDYQEFEDKIGIKQVE